MYKKQAVLKAGGYDGFPEDYRLWIKMLMNGAKFYNIQESLLYFRFSKNMIRRRGGWKYAIADIKSQIDFYKLGLFGISTLIYNILVRITVRLTPNYIRSLIYQKLLTTLESQGLSKIKTEKEDFNTDFHEAVAMVPVDEESMKGKVVDCVQTGYTLNNKVIRHSKVAVGQ